MLFKELVLYCGSTQDTDYLNFTFFGESSSLTNILEIVSELLFTFAIDGGDLLYSK